MFHQIFGVTGDGTDDWPGDSESPANDYKTLMSNNSTQIIATGTYRKITIFTDRMGVAGMRFARVR